MSLNVGDRVRIVADTWENELGTVVETGRVERDFYLYDVLVKMDLPYPLTPFHPHELERIL